MKRSSFKKFLAFFSLCFLFFLFSICSAPFLNLTANASSCNYVLPIATSSHTSGYFTIDDSGTLTSYSGTDATIEIPEEIDDITLKTIGEGVFKDKTTITSVALTLKCEVIEKDAFSGCTSLESITNTNNIVTICDSAFKGCISLTSATFLNAVTIGNSAFSGCTSLTSAHFSNLEVLSNSVFSGCTNLSEIYFPKLTSVGESSFNGCTSLTEIKSSTITHIYASAFQDCSALSNVNLPKAQEIKENAFSGSGVETMWVDTFEVEIDSNAGVPSSATIYGRDSSNISSYATDKGISFTEFTTLKFTQNLKTSITCGINFSQNLVISASGTGNLQYQWYKKNGMMDELLEGKVSNTLELDTANLGKTTYYVVVTDVVNNKIISAPCEVTIANLINITISSTGSGTFSPNSNTQFYLNDEVSFAFTPDTGYVVGKITIDDQEIIGDVRSYTFNNLTQPHTIQVDFVKKSFSINVNIVGKATYSLDSLDDIKLGDSRVINLESNGWNLHQVYQNGDYINFTGSSFKIENIDKNYDLLFIYSKEGFLFLGLDAKTWILILVCSITLVLLFSLFILSKRRNQMLKSNIELTQKVKNNNLLTKNNTQIQQQASNTNQTTYNSFSNTVQSNQQTNNFNHVSPNNLNTNQSTNKNNPTN